MVFWILFPSVPCHAFYIYRELNNFHFVHVYDALVLLGTYYMIINLFVKIKLVKRVKRSSNKNSVLILFLVLPTILKSSGYTG